MKTMIVNAMTNSLLLMGSLLLISCSSGEDSTDGAWQLIEEEDPMTGSVSRSVASMTSIDGGKLQTVITCGRNNSGIGTLRYQFTIFDAEVPFEYDAIVKGSFVIGRVRVNQHAEGTAYQQSRKFQNMFTASTSNIWRLDDTFVVRTKTGEHQGERYFEQLNRSVPVTIAEYSMEPLNKVLFEIPTNMGDVIIEIPGDVTAPLAQGCNNALTLQKDGCYGAENTQDTCSKFD